MNVYLREVEFGVGRNVVLWVDEKAREFKFFKHRNWIRYKQLDDKFNHFNKFVIKSNNFTAEAYLRSKLFKIIIKNCWSFKIIQNLERKYDQMAYKKQSMQNMLQPDLKDKQMCI